MEIFHYCHFIWHFHAVPVQKERLVCVHFPLSIDPFQTSPRGGFLPEQGARSKGQENTNSQSNPPAPCPQPPAP